MAELEQPIPQLAPPPTLRRICSVSCGIPARDLAGLLEREGVEVFCDTRVGRDYRGKGIGTSEADLRFLIETIGLQYEIVPELMPTVAMRAGFAATFKDVKRAADRDPSAWTNFLGEYEAELKARRALRTERMQRLLYGQHEAIAIVCACRHHDDCHRSYACGLLTTVLPGVTLRVLYPGGQEPARASPRRYRNRAFSWANLEANSRRR